MQKRQNLPDTTKGISVQSVYLDGIAVLLQDI